MNAAYPGAFMAGWGNLLGVDWWVQAVDHDALFDPSHVSPSDLSAHLVGDPVLLPDIDVALDGDVPVGVSCSAVDAESAVLLDVPASTAVRGVVVWAEAGPPVGDVLVCWLDRRRDRRPAAGVATGDPVALWWPPDGVVVSIPTGGM